MSTTGATLRLLDKADKEVLRLPRTVKGAFFDFQHKFKENPQAAGLHLKQLKGESRLWSAYVTDDYRALLLRLDAEDWLIVSVKHRKHVYENLDRLAYGINRITGGIEYVDLQIVEDSVLRGAGTPPSESSHRAPEAAGQAVAPAPEPLFARLTDEQLTSLGVAEPLIPVIRALTTEDQLLGLVEYAPQLTGEVLLALHDGKPYQEVLEQVTAPVSASEPVDAEDFQAAVERPATIVTTSDEALKDALEGGDFARWKILLHPTQSELVRRDYSGPARVGGGPGTGKTIVALHRVKHLVDKLPPGRNKPVLLTTYNKNLAADLRARLRDLGGEELLSRVDISHVDQLALRIVREAEPGSSKQTIDDARALREWQAMLDEVGEQRWDAEFLHDEWTQVILGQAVVSRADYFRARRAGRGRNVSRGDRAEIWQLAERFTQRLDRLRQQTWAQVAERAARLEMEREQRLRAVERRREEAGGLENVHLQDGSAGWLRYRYRHIVVDEAQDLRPGHWKMLRAMVPHDRNDIFLVGDTHQRIYQNQVTLGSLGINIRGRSARLTLSYRTTRQILGSALGLLSGEHFDDLDGGDETLAGYRSVLSGARPAVHESPDWETERQRIAELITEWNDIPPEQVAVCVPTNVMASELASTLARNGIPAVEIGPDGPRGDGGVHIGTMYRFKGLEYQRMIIAGVREGLVPREAVLRLERTDPVRHRRELQRACSLLFVAATRSRDALAIFWHDTPSRFLRPLIPGGTPEASNP
ncbi:UvrD-helicase domain-containing protein [Allostreptomyces psammosilenae]|uniref:Superfamily I DNA/RNA helicase/mRNA-degrading endonuclease RelE of RelBE toxin-antitoxin system n=1 Tax=Allostreptomyces psammosilenae TaxID=1892865 RepID=A0A852ZXZ1_9ACTN|nr:UvrD-helicase domain-containing protein [Allostreptomyces psammosilenae]NYI03501.1 superfamily I DNA/RNA helicase/mRNA-degrading endonuclease RelE of RelBE toxin-antitoxin system [Allostreptomyces psammosilenae]